MIFSRQATIKHIEESSSTPPLLAKTPAITVHPAYSSPNLHVACHGGTPRGSKRTKRGFFVELVIACLGKAHASVDLQGASCQ